MSFYSSPIRSALIFSRCYERLRHRSTLTRKQVKFLAYVIENGHMMLFTVGELTYDGISYDQAYQYLCVLRRKGFATKAGRSTWQLTGAAHSFYSEFMGLYKSYDIQRKFWT